MNEVIPFRKKAIPFVVRDTEKSVSLIEYCNNTLARLEPRMPYIVIESDFMHVVELFMANNWTMQVQGTRKGIDGHAVAYDVLVTYEQLQALTGC